jgi:hypothetical protein
MSLLEQHILCCVVYHRVEMKHLLVHCATLSLHHMPTLNSLYEVNTHSAIEIKVV